jgi:hypothetical protein
MKSITIHGLDARLYERIKEKAKRQGLSLNKTIKKLLEKSLGIDSHEKNGHRQDFMDLFGVWPRDEVEEFAKSIEEFEQIDAEDWK